jgi:hypothetical protein
MSVLLTGAGLPIFFDVDQPYPRVDDPKAFGGRLAITGAVTVRHCLEPMAQLHEVVLCRWSCKHAFEVRFG